MCWYVLERYVFSLTKTSYLTPEFQKHSLGIGMYTALFVTPPRYFQPAVTAHWGTHIRVVWAMLVGSESFLFPS